MSTLPPQPPDAGEATSERAPPGLAFVRREVAALTDIGRTMVSHVDYEQALAAVIERTARILDSETGAFMLYEEETGLLSLQRPAFGLADSTLVDAYRVPLTATESNAVKVFLSGVAYMTNDFRRDPNMAQRFVQMSVAERVMTVPLQVEGRSIGVFHVQDKRSGDYTDEDLELLTLMAPTLAVLITSARMLRELRDQRQRLETALEQRQAELARAARIQRELLPEGPPDLAGYDVAAACLPAQLVAGDFYDWVRVDERTLVFTVADVMGKGVAASLVMATLRAALRAAPHKMGAADRVRRAEESMALNVVDDGLFVTLFHGVLDLPSGSLRYVDAGHGHVTILGADGALRSLPERSLPVGVSPGEPFQEGTLSLARGDTLLVFSDGLVEHEGQTGSPGDFREELEAGGPAQDTVGRLLGRMPASLDDDVTVMVLRRLRADGSAGPWEGGIDTRLERAIASPSSG